MQGSRGPLTAALRGGQFNLQARFCCRFAAGAVTGDQRCNFRALYVERIDGDFRPVRYRRRARVDVGSVGAENAC